MSCKYDKNESLPVVIGLNVNVLSDRKSAHTHSRRKVAYATRRENYTSPLIGFSFAFVIRIRHSHSSFALRTRGIFATEYVARYTLTHNINYGLY